MGRMTKGEAAQIVETFYGINPNTYEVESVSHTRGGSLQKFDKESRLYTHQIAPGRNAQTEVVVVFHLTNIVRVPALVSDAQRKSILEELRAKAEEMKAAPKK